MLKLFDVGGALNFLRLAYIFLRRAKYAPSGPHSIDAVTSSVSHPELPIWLALGPTNPKYAPAKSIMMAENPKNRNRGLDFSNQFDVRLTAK
ncbi:MAG: hypothetical protein I8H88_04965 [Burkholderiales bacterium]|nr:hypothetical protein [Burkholderiales bacterium]